MGKKPAKILLVDDEPDIVKTTKMGLELCGYAVVTASDGQEAIDAVYREKPDLLVIDMMLPKFNADQVIRVLKNDEQYKNIPIILITALSQKNEEESIRKLNVDCCMIKPFDLNELCVKIKTLLGS